MNTGEGLVVDGVGVTINGSNILEDVAFNVPAGRMTALIGANGAGKSTLLHALLGIARPRQGTMRFAGTDLVTLSAGERAQRIAFVAQTSTTDWPLDCRTVVGLGRIPFPTRPGDGNAVIVDAALAAVNMTAFADRDYRTLSGGEQQRIQIARAIAQAPRLLLLDEPTSHLDVRAQVDILTLLRQQAEAGLTILVTVHDLTLVAGYFDHLIALNAGRVAASGPPDAVLTPELVQLIYDVPAEVVNTPSGRRLVVPL